MWINRNLDISRVLNTIENEIKKVKKWLYLWWQNYVPLLTRLNQFKQWYLLISSKKFNYLAFKINKYIPLLSFIYLLKGAKWNPNLNLDWIFKNNKLKVNKYSKYFKLYLQTGQITGILISANGLCCRAIESIIYLSNMTCLL